MRSFRGPLAPVDDLAPQIVVTYVGTPRNGQVVVRGVVSDSGPVNEVSVNGKPARALRPDFAEWEIVLEAPVNKVAVRAVDGAGNAGVCG